MDIASLSEFIAFSKNLNVTKTAESLHMAPSSLSRHLSGIEKELGISLISRTGPKLALTAAGQMVLDASSAITARYDALLEQIDALSRIDYADIRVTYALDDRTTIDAISLAFASLRPALPGVSLRAVRVQESDPIRALEKNEADLAVLYDITGVDEGIWRVVPFWKDRILIALPKNKANEARTSVNPQEVMGCTVPWPSASRENYLARAMRLFDDCPTKPSIHWIDADNMDTFFMHQLEEREIWFLSNNHRERYIGNISACFANSIVPCEVEGVDATLMRYAVHRRGIANKAVEMLADELGSRFDAN